MSKPPLLIGISPRIVRRVPAELGFRDKTLQYLEQSVAHWLMSHGVAPVMLPAIQGSDSGRASKLTVQAFADAMDGLLLQGGVDLNPALYGQAPEHILGEVDPIRDAFELALIRAFFAAGKPIFGICRGMQLINVAFGGSLYQDLIKQGVTDFSHVDSERYDLHEHPVNIVTGTRMSQWYGGQTTGTINSIHHQAVDRLGEGLEIVATAPDGVVEAIMARGQSFVFGAQWHPEFHDGRNPELLSADPLMLAFLQAADERKADRLSR